MFDDTELLRIFLWIWDWYAEYSYIKSNKKYESVLNQRSSQTNKSCLPKLPWYELWSLVMCVATCQLPSPAAPSLLRPSNTSKLMGPFLVPLNIHRCTTCNPTLEQILLLLLYLSCKLDKYLLTILLEIRIWWSFPARKQARKSVKVSHKQFYDI